MFNNIQAMIGNEFHVLQALLIAKYLTVITITTLSCCCHCMATWMDRCLVCHLLHSL